MNAGLISERVRRVCKAVRNENKSVEDDGWVGSVNIDCKGVAEDEARARAKLSRRDENPLEAEGGGECDPVGGGEGGGLRVGFKVETFFLPVNERKKDHSDSN